MLPGKPEMENYISGTESIIHHFLKFDKRAKSSLNNNVSYSQPNTIVKGTVIVISSESPFKEDNVRFTTVPLKPQSDRKCGRYSRFLTWKVFISLKVWRFVVTLNKTHTTSLSGCIMSKSFLVVYWIRSYLYASKHT